MPNRMLRDWTDSLKFDGISADAERLFLRLIMKADDYGRFHADPRLLKAGCFPLVDNLRPNDLSRWLEELSSRQLILRYEADGRSILAIVNYGQRLKSSKAKFPPFPGMDVTWLPTSDAFPEVPGSSGNQQEIPARREEKRSRREVENEGEGKGTGSAGAADAAPKPAGKCSLDEAKAFAVEIGMPESDGEALFYKWQGNGWKNGQNLVKDWKATMRSWKASGYLPSQKGGAKPAGKAPTPTTGVQETIELPI